MSKKLPYLVDVNGGQYSFLLSEEQDISLVNFDENQKYVIHDFKSKLISVKEKNHHLKFYEIQIDGRTYKVQLLDELDQQILKMNLKAKKLNLHKEIKAPMPGLVRQVNTKEGDLIKKGDALIILEAMKMENVLKSPIDGIVSEILVKQGESVEKNQILLSIK
ncbi:MAG: acetyl-CoA carboxylase biotin carboxyl carrier protein subunit [Bacteroidetes bacterium]|nr:acetyl-CoA carboxylase biotin carboxyl carrier protein subunit [Bacteroidota bacterium]